jgi:hypothetical protein
MLVNKLKYNNPNRLTKWIREKHLETCSIVNSKSEEKLFR